MLLSVRIKKLSILRLIFFLNKLIRNCNGEYINSERQFTRKVFKPLAYVNLAIFALVLRQITSSKRLYIKKFNDKRAISNALTQNHEKNTILFILFFFWFYL